MNNENLNQHITEFLHYYCNLPSPQYAVMLKGKWGSGKTHYVKDYLKTLDQESQKYVYVSLYGVTSYDEIETKFLEALHPTLYNKKTLLSGKIAKGLLKAELKVDIDEAHIQHEKNIPLLDTEEQILIFDDLERCSIDINDLLGYINYFVEHQHYKVIVLANDEKFTSDNYKDIKEKLIGKTFEVVSNTDLAYESFIHTLNNELFTEYKKDIIGIYIQSGYNNLRVLRQAILDFDRFSHLIELKLFKKELIYDLIIRYFMLSIESKLSDFQILDMNQFRKESTRLIKKASESEIYTKYKKVVEKYTQVSFNETIFSFELWNDIINKSLIIRENVIEQIRCSSHYSNENIISWKKLYYFYTFSDDKFREILSEVETSFFNNEYKDLFIVKHVYVILINLQDIGLYNKSFEEITKILKINIDKLYYENLFTESSYDKYKDNTMYDNLAYFDSSLDKGIFEEYIYSKFTEIDTVIMKEQAALFTKTLDPEVLLKIKGKNTYYRKPLFMYLEINEFFENFTKEFIEKDNHFEYIFEKRYTNPKYLENLIYELDFLHELEKKLEKEYEIRKTKLSGYRTNNYLQVVKQAIVDLDK